MPTVHKLQSMPVNRQPADLGILRHVAGGVTEEARIGGFASLTLAKFALIKTVILTGGSDPSILGCT